MNITAYRILFYLGQVLGLIPRHGLYVTTELGYVVFVRGKLRAWYFGIRGPWGSYVVIDLDGYVEQREGWEDFEARVRRNYGFNVPGHLKWLSGG